MKTYAIVARLGVGFMLVAFWGLVDNPLFGVVFILVLLGLSGLRYRFGMYIVPMALEVVVCIGYALVWPPALLGLWLPVLGLLENKWFALERQLIDRDHQERAGRLRLEAQMEAAARDSQNAARLAEMTERARIAQDIHDHVGHEMHGALIALQTTKKLHEKNDPRTGELLSQSLQRLESASATLRETVHNLKPAQTIGVEILSDICDSFGYCPADFTKTGDLTGVAHWELLAANLKELLTNVARHSGASAVAVKVDGNDKYIRLTVRDNGKIKKAPSLGLGLTGMKDRVRAAGGNLTINVMDGFQAVCVLPKMTPASF